MITNIKEVLFLFAWAFVSLGCSQFQSESTVTLYSIQKTDDGTYFPHNPSEYRIDYDSQTVVRKIVGTVYRYEKCKIFDIENWECEYNDGSGVIGYRDGEYFSDDPIRREQIEKGIVKQVSGFVWWLYHLGIK